MRKKLFSVSKVIMVVGCLFMLSNCTSTSVKMNEVPLAGGVISGGIAVEELKRSEYEIIGDVTGIGKTSFVLGFIQIDGFNQNSDAKMIAVFNAIRKIPGADALIAPRYEIKKAWYLAFETETVTVYGKAIRLKTDKELQQYITID